MPNQASRNAPSSKPLTVASSSVIVYLPPGIVAAAAVRMLVSNVDTAVAYFFMKGSGLGVQWRAIVTSTAVGAESWRLLARFLHREVRRFRRSHQ